MAQKNFMQRLEFVSCLELDKQRTKKQNGRANCYHTFLNIKMGYLSHFGEIAWNRKSKKFIDHQKNNRPPAPSSICYHEEIESSLVSSHEPCNLIWWNLNLFHLTSQSWKQGFRNGNLAKKPHQVGRHVHECALDL